MLSSASSPPGNRGALRSRHILSADAAKPDAGPELQFRALAAVDQPPVDVAA